VLLLAACSPQPAAQGPSPSPASTAPDPPPPTPTPTPTADHGGALHIGIAEPQAIIPSEATEPDDLLVVDALFDSLTRYAHNFVPVPAAASAWSSNDDATEWTFALRTDATFHDGSPVTADDFAFSWNRAVRRGTAGFHLRDVDGYAALVRGDAATLRGVEAVDAHTLRVRLARPRGEFPAVVAHPALGPLPRARWEADPDGFRAEPVGNGPFAAAEAWVPGQYIRLRRAQTWGQGSEAARLDEVLFQIMDPETAFVAFQQGRLQISPLPEGAREPAVEQFGLSADGYEGPGVLHGATPAVYFLGFNVAEPPFDDPDVRRAISLAIDRERIVAAVEAGNVEPADALVGPTLGGRAGSCEACRHDPQEAAALLADRGVDEVALWFNAGGGHGVVAEQIRSDLRRAGIGTVVLRRVPFETYLGALESGAAELFRFGWRPEYPLADDLLTPLFHSGELGERNYMRYASEDVDALLDQARASPTSARRRFALGQAEEQIVNRDQVVVPLMRYRHNRVVAAEVEDFRLDALGYANLHEVTVSGR
jgi:oligopeptide transport system substrate-binding protein